MDQTNGDEAKLNLLLFELTPSLLYFIPLFSGTWPPLFFFFFCHASWHAFLFFWDNHVYKYFRDVAFGERSLTQGAFILWMVDHAHSWCRNFASGSGRVRYLDRESMKRFSLGSHNLTKLNEIANQHMSRVFKVI